MLLQKGHQEGSCKFTNQSRRSKASQHKLENLHCLSLSCNGERWSKYVSIMVTKCDKNIKHGVNGKLQVTQQNICSRRWRVWASVAIKWQETLRCITLMCPSMLVNMTWPSFQIRLRAVFAIYYFDMFFSRQLFLVTSVSLLLLLTSLALGISWSGHLLLMSFLSFLVTYLPLDNSISSRLFV